MPSSSPPAARAMTTRATSSNVLGSAEIQSGHVTNAHEAVLRFRPEFLRGRVGAASTSPNGTPPIVYVNGVREGDVSALRTIPAAIIDEIRYLSPVSASQEVGTYYPGGVIFVRTRR
jgi:hypothetical protein